MNSNSKLNASIEPDLSVVVPVLNESESLPELCGQIRTSCEKLNLSFEVVVVDDGSTDETCSVLEKLNNDDSRFKMIQFRRNFGKADALSAGFQAASGQMVITMDGDLQDDPAEIGTLIKKLDEGYDLVSGWKKKRKDPLSKKIPSFFWNKMTSFLTGIRLHDFNCGLKIYRKEVVKSVHVYGELHRYIPALAHVDGFRVGEMVVNHRPRKYGKTKYGVSRFLKGLLDMMTVLFLARFTKRPLHLFGPIGIGSFIAGSGITIYLIILRITKTAYLSNRPLLFIGVLLIILGVQFISIGLLGEMITRSNAPKHRYAIRRSLGV